MAGEGSKGERGRSPLSYSLPLSNEKFFWVRLVNLFERGTKGVSITNVTRL
jgi:hypothetical protein